MKTVLLVDDDPSIRALLQLYLESAGYATAEAADGHLGVGILDELPVDLVVLDIFMPEMDGLEVLRIIRKRCRPCKVLVISGGSALAGLDMLAHASMFGADAVLEKPFSQQALLDLVDRLIGSPDGEEK